MYSEVAKKSVSARPGPILEETLGTRMGPGRAGMAPTSGLGWVRNTVKQSTWRIWTGPLGTRDGTWTGPGSDPGEGLDGTPKDSNRLLGLSDVCVSEVLGRVGRSTYLVPFGLHKSHCKNTLGEHSRLHKEIWLEPSFGKGMRRSAFRFSVKKRVFQ